MAEETKRIIEIEAKYETLAQLQKIIEQNKAAIADLDKTSYAYQKGLSELKSVQSEYNQNMRLAVKENVSAKGSYNDLVNQLARLKEMWKQADPSTDAFKQYTEQVNNLKARLEAMDHSIGNWQRNVGNYAGSIRSVAGLFGQAGSAATGAVAGVQGLTMGFKALSATPVIGILTVLVSVLMKIISSLKQSEAASMRMAEALAPLKAGGDLVQIAFEKLGDALASVAEWLGRVADKLGLYNDRMKETQSITKDTNALKLRERELEKENARLELESAQQRGIAADKANHSAAERVKALEAAEAAEKKILANELEVAQARFDLLKRQAALSPNDSAMNDELAQAEANLYRVQTSYEQGMRRITSQHSSALQEMRNGTAAAVTESKEAVVELAQVNEAAFDQMDKTIAKQMEARKAYEAEMADILKAIAADDAALQAEIEGTSDALTKSLTEDIERQMKAAEDMKRGMIGVANAIASVMDSVAGAYQNEIKAQVDAGKISEKEGEKQFQNVKALQIAVSTIQMLTGITTALSGAFTTKTGPWDIALAAAQAASIAASGIANIAKISNTTLGNTQTSSAVGSGVQSVQTVAPAVQVAVPEYRTLTSASDEQSINGRFADQKVVLVTSELEAHNEGRRVKLQESTF